MGGWPLRSPWGPLVAVVATTLAALLLPASAGAAPPSVPETASWLQNHRVTTVWAGPEEGRALAPAAQWTRFRLAGPQVKMRVPVVDDRLGATGWVDALDLGPVGPPSAPPSAVPAPATAAPSPAAPAPSPPPVVAPPPVLPTAPVVAPPVLPTVPAGPSTATTVPAVQTERWLQSHRATTLWSAPTAGAASRTLAQWTHLRMSGPSHGERVPVFEPVSQSDGWVDAVDVGPAGAPPAPTPAPAPAPVVVPRPDAQSAGHAALQVAPPRPRAVGPDERWIDVDLAKQRLRLVQGDRVVRSVPVTTGKPGFRTPTGTFRIFHRVEQDVMDSATLGVDRDSAEGYLLRNVRYSQYFADGGFALHANYWQPPSVFGQVATSHGCVGMAEGDAAAVWSFAGNGTLVHVH
jgi:lipoprotein-anchoring transpeptidase ErfK/SrfK